MLYAGQPLPHFNEVDECAGLDGLMTQRVHAALGQPVENTLHDLLGVELPKLTVPALTDVDRRVVNLSRFSVFFGLARPLARTTWRVRASYCFTSCLKT